MMKNPFKFRCAEGARSPSITVALIFALIAGFSTLCNADNPLVSHVYTADPAARVYNGRVYVVVTHDQDTQSDYSQLRDYYLFSSDDMVNWQDHGIIWNSKSNTNWADLAYAPDFIYRNGRYYLYYPNGSNSIGVAVADKPEGPYTDPLGHPLIDRNTPNADVDWIFDPGVFIDDDGQAYLYFGGGGNGNARVIRLNRDMISTSGPAITLDVPNFFEALSMNKRNGTYYLTYSTSPGTGMHIDYMTSDNPTSGFAYRGTVLGNPWANNYNNNHQSIVEYNGQWYIFYHNRAVSNERGGNVYNRSINVDRLFFNADGSIKEVNDTRTGVKQLKRIDPFTVNQAETFDKEKGIETDNTSDGTLQVVMDRGDWIRISGVDFSGGAQGMSARLSAGVASGLDIILDDIKNKPVSTLTMAATGDSRSWRTGGISFATVTGVHDLYLRATSALRFNWYQFNKGKISGSTSSMVQLQAAPRDGQVNLSWSVQGDIRYAQIYRDTDSNIKGRGRIAILTGDKRSFTDTSVVNGQTYWYWVKYIDTDNRTGNSNASSVTPVRAANINACDADPVSGTYYSIVNRGSGKVLDVYGGSTRNGANLIQWPYKRSDNQQFRLIDLGNGYWLIEARHSGRVVDVADYSRSNGANVQQWDYLSGKNQQWALRHSSNGGFNIVSRQSGKSLTVNNAESGANVYQQSDSAGAFQRWYFSPIDGSCVSGSDNPGDSGSNPPPPVDNGGSNPPPPIDGSPEVPANNTCASVDEHEALSISCPSGQVISAIAFASYGTPTGSCGSYAAGSCNASNSLSAVSQACEGKTNCSLRADNTTFGDPCYGTVKRLSVQAICAKSGAEPPPDVPQNNTGVTSLKSLANFPIGVAVNVGNGSKSIISGASSQQQQSVVFPHFDQMTAGNIMKMSYLHPSENSFTFDVADRFIEFAHSHGIDVHGHTLIWHSDYQVPAFMKNYSGDFAGMLKRHVQTIVSHFRGKVVSWDVVNEALADNGGSGPNGLRNSVFYQKMGERYIDEAFINARAADPNVDLFYNDYSIENSGAKTDHMLSLVDGLLARGVPISGVGFQMHVLSTWPSVSTIESAMRAVADRGLKVKISELDVRVNNQYDASAPVYQSLTAEAAATQKVRYQQIVAAYQRAVPPAQRAGITVWGVWDDDSWLNTPEHPDWPLLFDENFNAKQALQGFADGLR